MAWLRGEVTRHRDYKVAGFSPGRGNKGTSLLKACFGQQLKKKNKKKKPRLKDCVPLNPSVVLMSSFLSPYTPPKCMVHVYTTSTTGQT